MKILNNTKKKIEVKLSAQFKGRFPFKNYGRVIL